MGSHLVDGQFKSDKFPETPVGLVPLACTDATAQDLLWEYAQRRRVKDAQFSADLEQALRNAGYAPKAPDIFGARVVACAQCQFWERVGDGAHEHSCIKSEALLLDRGKGGGGWTRNGAQYFCPSCTARRVR